MKTTPEVELVLAALIDPWGKWRSKRADLKRLLLAAQRLRKYEGERHTGSVAAAKAYDAAMERYR